jgi:hypothetical protein
MHEDTYGNYIDLLSLLSGSGSGAVQVEVQVLAQVFDLVQGLAVDMEAAPQVETIVCLRLNSR